jgi:hypothetical protein
VSKSLPTAQIVKFTGAKLLQQTDLFGEIVTGFGVANLATQIADLAGAQPAVFAAMQLLSLSPLTPLKRGR